MYLVIMEMANIFIRLQSVVIVGGGKKCDITAFNCHQQYYQVYPAVCSGLIASHYLNYSPMCAYWSKWWRPRCMSKRSVNMELKPTIEAVVVQSGVETVPASMIADSSVPVVVSVSTLWAPAHISVLRSVVACSVFTSSLLTLIPLCIQWFLFKSHFLNV